MASAVWRPHLLHPRSTDRCFLLIVRGELLCRFGQNGSQDGFELRRAAAAKAMAYFM
jgi:hypothetical protein